MLTSTTRTALLAGAVLLLAPRPGAAQSEGAAHLPDLVHQVRERNPSIRAARRVAAAAEARIPQAGALPDPVLATGLMYVPVPDFDLSAEAMTMFSAQLSQRIPVPGSRSLRERAAGALHAAALRDAEEVEIQVVSRLKAAYHELVFVHDAERVFRRNRALLEDLAGIAGRRLAVGRVVQQDVLRAQTEVSRIDEQLVALEDRRIAALSEINALLDRDPLEPVVPTYPQDLRSVAMARPPAGAFTAAALDGGIGRGFPEMAALQARALRSRPGLRAHVARIQAVRLGRDLAERERWPGLEVMLAYSPRVARRDMVSVGLSMDLPVFRGRKQDQALAEAGEILADHEIRHHTMVAEIRSEVTRRYSALLRTRERILLVEEGVLPQARATVESATGAYQAGRLEFTGLLEAQATLFRQEIELIRLLADFGKELAALEAAVGEGIDLPTPDTEEPQDGHETEMNR